MIQKIYQIDGDRDETYKQDDPEESKKKRIPG
jgi:hypothetical protein